LKRALRRRRREAFGRDFRVFVWGARVEKRRDAHVHELRVKTVAGSGRLRRSRALGALVEDAHGREHSQDEAQHRRD
jgi:hypothetical protein